jgi:hypothetical protein
MKVTRVSQLLTNGKEQKAQAESAFERKNEDGVV